MSFFLRYLKHISTSWSQHYGLQISTLTILTASLSVVFGVSIFSKNLQKILSLWGDSLQMTVYLDDQASNEGVSEVQSFLAGKPMVEKTKLVTSEQALLEFREQIASYAPDLLSDIELVKFIPRSLQLSFKNEFLAQDQVTGMNAIAEELKKFSAVKEINFGQEWVKNFSALTRFFQGTGMIFVLITVLGCLFVISNSIRASVAQRKNEVEVLELIGASSRYIRGPFIFEGAMLGFISSFLACVLMFGIYKALKTELMTELQFLQIAKQISFIGVRGCFFVMGVSTVFGAFSSWLCVRRLNTGWAASSNQEV